MIITYKHDIYELPKDLGLKNLGNIRKVSKPHKDDVEPSLPAKMKILLNLTFPVVGYFTWKVELVSDILWMIVSSNLFFILTRPTSLQT